MRVHVNLSARPEGEMIEVLHLGVFPNGQYTEVEEGQAESWRQATGREDLPDTLEITDQPESSQNTNPPDDQGMVPEQPPQEYTPPPDQQPQGPQTAPVESNPTPPAATPPTGEVTNA